MVLEIGKIKKAISIAKVFMPGADWNGLIFKLPSLMATAKILMPYLEEYNKMPLYRQAELNEAIRDLFK